MKNVIPKHLHFGGLNQGEEVKLFLRRHVITLWSRIGWLLFVGLIPVVLWIILLTQTDWITYGDSTMRIVVVLVFSLFYLYWLRLLFTIWLDYYLDVWVVTNQRILNIDHDGLFHRKISEQQLSRVQDVTTEISGFLQTTMNFGDIHVQTAAETEHFIFRDISEPEFVSKKISLLQRQAQDGNIGDGDVARPRMPQQEDTEPHSPEAGKDNKKTNN